MHNLRLEEGSKTEEFLKTCRAKIVVHNELVECLIERSTCNCFMFFGNMKLCKHTLKFDIVKRTQEESETSK